MINTGDLVRVTYSSPPKWMGMIGLVLDVKFDYAKIKLPDGFIGWWTFNSLELVYSV